MTGVRRMAKILISAGDASGQILAAGFVRAMRARAPDAQFLGLVGPLLEAEGVREVASQRALAVGGFLELLPSLSRIVDAWQRMRRAAREEEPDLVVLIDSGGFNLPLARVVRRSSRARILYFAPPQVWAWRKRRLRKLVSRVDRIAVIFPFERDFYREQGVAVDFVGHPLLDGAEPVTSVDAACEARRSLGLDPCRPVLGLYPGSRRNEVKAHLEIQIAAIERLIGTRSDLASLQVVVALAPSLDANEITRRVEAFERGHAAPSVRVLPSGETLRTAIDVALVKPGSVTLELMLAERPMVVMGRTHPLTAAIFARGVSVPWFSLPNLIAGEGVVPECIQAQATPDRIARQLAALLPRSDSESDRRAPAADAQVEGFRRARKLLGEPGASARVARIAEEMLGTPRT